MAGCETASTVGSLAQLRTNCLPRTLKMTFQDTTNIDRDVVGVEDRCSRPEEWFKGQALALGYPPVDKRNQVDLGQ